MAKINFLLDKIFPLFRRIRTRCACSRLTRYDAAFLCLLVYGAFIRLAWLAPPYLNGDSQRDYLASHHIVAYQDYPLLGPWSTLFGIIVSPIYFYFLALFLFIKDSILTLQYVNIILQIVTLIVFYIFTKKIFSARTALIAAILTILSHTVFLQTMDFWQPGIMMSFLTLSYFLLLLAYTKKNYWLLLCGLSVFTFACVIYQSAIAISPLFLVATLIILKMWRMKIKQYIGALLAIVLPFILMHIPVFIYLLEKQEEGKSFLLVVGEKFVPSLDQFIINFVQAMKFFIALFLRPIGNEPSPSSILFIIGITIACGIYFLNRQHAPLKKTCIGLMSVAMLFPMLSTSLFTIPLTARYFIPVFGFFLVLIAEYINSLFSNNKLFVAFGIILSLLLITNFSFSPSMLTPPMRQVARENPLTQDFALIADTVTDIQQKEQRQDPRFFQAALYSYSNQFSWFPAELWNGIEKKFDTQFVIYDGFRRSPRDYMPISTDDYIFVVCNSQFMNIDPKTCFHTFSQENHGYSLVKEMPTRYSTLYLMKNGR